MTPGAPVELARLVVLVRVRRVLRQGARLAVLAVPVWFAVVIAVVESTDDYTPTHIWIDDHANRGFVIILTVLAVALALSAGVRLAGAAGTTAARLVPMLRAVPDPVIAIGSGRERLLDAGSRNRRGPAPGNSWWATVALRVGFGVLVLMIAIPGSMVRAQYRAGHGEGGPVITLGENSRITRSVDGGDNVDYYVSSPAGEALVDGAAKPAGGTRFVVIETVNGRQAVHVGGYSWITSLVVAILAFLFACVILFFVARRRLARVADGRIVPLATTLDDLARGRSVTVQPASARGRTRPATELTARVPRGAADAVAERVRRHVRIVTAVVIGLLTLVALAVAAVS